MLSDNYDKIREFFQTETDAFIAAASLHYFGMHKVTDHPTKNSFPGNIKKSSVPVKRVAAQRNMQHVGHVCHGQHRNSEGS